ncbi:MAG: glycosyl transferase [Gammaproteobacteria bacterium]|nr:MAG: glycosyl transferase [Gammaproteobacteria bacterium]
MRPLFPEPPSSLCLLRLSALGDVVQVVPVVRNLQRAWPECRLTWIIGTVEAGLVGDLPGVEFITFDKRGGLAAWRRTAAALRGRRFDALLLMQVALRANLLSLAVRAPLRLGFDAGRARNGHGLFVNRRIAPAPRSHVLEGFFAFAEALGVKERRLVWDLPIPDTARRRVAGWLADDRRPLLVINPASSARLRNWRNWPAERYAAVADHAAQKHGMRVVLSGGGAAHERALAEAILARCRSRPENWVGRTSLKELLALLERARALIAPDTGPVHMATAVGTPVIGLYATSNPDRTGPYLSRRWVVNRYPEAVRRYLGGPVEALRWGQRVRHPEAMALIETEAVIDTLDRLLAETADQPGGRTNPARRQ